MTSRRLANQRWKRVVYVNVVYFSVDINNVRQRRNNVLNMTIFKILKRAKKSFWASKKDNSFDHTKITQNGQTHSNNFSITVDELFECVVWPFVGAEIFSPPAHCTHLCNKFFQTQIRLNKYWCLRYLSKLLTKLFD